ncbi:DUF3310 domain-containing protein [Veillonella sp. VA142]|uniref:DUF3310 domain-containing protein n=1 Tax=Veillonella sp. VA142 TaxID=741834 RepID=UPI000F8F82B1|nr:DUF3310 domain-containing protein [Veillonella sp. VA142]
MSDNVKNPSYYNRGKIEVWEFIEDQGLDYHTGNAVKYIARAGFKDPSKEVEDLQKAIAFLERKIKVLNGTNDINTEIIMFKDYAESLTLNQYNFLEEQCNHCVNRLSIFIDEYKKEATRHFERQCIKWFYSLLIYSNLIKDERIEQKKSDIYKKMVDVGIF